MTVAFGAGSAFLASALLLWGFSGCLPLASGLKVRNVFRARLIPWEDIAAVRWGRPVRFLMGPGAVAHLELRDGGNLVLWGIPRGVTRGGQRALDELKAALFSHGSVPAIIDAGGGPAPPATAANAASIARVWRRVGVFEALAWLIVGLATSNSAHDVLVWAASAAVAFVGSVLALVTAPVGPSRDRVLRLVVVGTASAVALSVVAFDVGRHISTPTIMLVTGAGCGVSLSLLVMAPNLARSRLVALGLPPSG
jgi:hypothetical protein